MPIKHAALKQIRKGRKLESRNQAVRAELKTLTKRFLGLLSEKKVDEAKTLIHVVASKYDRAASKGVLHRNTADRFKSRLMHRLNQQRTA